MINTPNELILFEKIFNNTHTAIAIMDKDFNFIKVNELYAKADNRTVADFPGHNHFEFYPNNEVKSIFERVVLTKQTYQIFSLPFTYPANPERGISYWDWTLEPVTDINGEVEILIFTLVNVTEQKKKEIELEHFFELSHDLLCILNYDFVVKQVNRAFHHTLGYTKGEIIGTKLIEYIHPEDITPTLNEFSNLSQTHISFIKITNRFSCKNDTYKWIDWTYVPIPEERLFYCIGRDITNRKRMEKAIEQSNNQVTNILESISDSFFILDNNWNFTYINKAARTVYPDAKVGTNIWQSYPRLVGTIFYNSYYEAKITGKPVRFESFTPYSGKWFKVAVYPSTNGLSVYFVDITERKKNEQEIARLDRLNLIGKMAAGIGHEVRNPMTAVRGFLQMLSQKPKFTEEKEFFDLMISELDRANSIITEFLSLARNKPTKLEKNNLSLIIEELYPLLQADALNLDKNILLELTTVPAILLNKKEIRQLILNLVRNGLEAMSPGGAVLIKTYLSEQEIVLAISDEGPGIDLSIINNLGTPFLTTKEHGTGLGLATCYSIAERNNARINFDSSPTGTTFYVKFRL